MITGKIYTNKDIIIITTIMALVVSLLNLHITLFAVLWFGIFYSFDLQRRGVKLMIFTLLPLALLTDFNLYGFKMLITRPLMNLYPLIKTIELSEGKGITETLKASIHHPIIPWNMWVNIIFSKEQLLIPAYSIICAIWAAIPAGIIYCLHRKRKNWDLLCRLKNKKGTSLLQQIDGEENKL